MAAAVSSFTPISATPIDETPPAGASGAFTPISTTPIDETSPPRRTIELGANPGAGFGVLGDVALTAGSGFVRSVASAVNDLLPEAIGGQGTRAAAQQDIDKYLTYTPQTAGGQAVVDAAGRVLQPVGALLGRIKQGIADYTTPRTADVLADVATIAGARLPVKAADTVPLAEGAGAVAPEAAAAARAAPEAAIPSGFSVAAAKPGETPQMHIRGATTAADQGVATEFAQPNAEGAEQGALPAATQAARAQTLRDIGLKEARESAISGDTKATGTDFNINKLDDEDGPGARMSGVIDSERAALQKYASDLRDNAASTADNDYTRGATIAEPIKQLRDWYDTQTDQLYKLADTAAQRLPIEMPSTAQILGNKADFMMTTGGKQLREGVLAKMRDLGVADEDGNVTGGTVRQAQALRQSISAASTGDNWRLAKQLIGAIDDDTARAAGQDIYKQARAMRADRATVLDDPTGISRLAEPDDRLGINRAVPLEKIGDYVTSLPVDQFKHIVGTLRDMPNKMPGAPALHQSAADALNEIRAQFADKVQAAGNSTQSMWNAKAASKYLRDNQLRMREVFSPAEMQQFKTLNDAGNILRMDRSYAGAGVNLQNIGAALGAGTVKHGATAIGGIVGGALGSPVEGLAGGRYVGGKLAGNLEKRAALAAAEKRIRQL